MPRRRRCAWGDCQSDNTRRNREFMQGVTFVPFPKPKSKLEKCKEWIRLCNRPRQQLNVDRIGKQHFVCSKHFKPGSDVPERAAFTNAIKRRKASKEHLTQLAKVAWEFNNIMNNERASSMRILKEGGIDLDRLCPSSPVPMLLVKNTCFHGTSKPTCSSQDTLVSGSLDDQIRSNDGWIKKEPGDFAGTSSRASLASSLQGNSVGTSMDDCEGTNYMIMDIKTEKRCLPADESIKEETPMEEEHIPDALVPVRRKIPVEESSSISDISDDCSNDKESKEEDHDQSLDADDIKPEPVTGTTQQFLEQKVCADGNGPLSELYQCSQCKLVFSSTQLLEFHMKYCCVAILEMLLEKQSFNFRCTVCNEGFGSAIVLDAHMNFHPPQHRPPQQRYLIFDCKVCKKEFRSSRELSIHMRTHPQIKPFQCDQCDMIFGSEINLIMHKKLKHRCQKKPPSCSESRTHSTEQPEDPGARQFKCDSNDSSDDRDKEIESGDQPQCMDSSAIATERVHEEEVSTDVNGPNNEDFHQCAQCKLIFSSSHLLESHVIHYCVAIPKRPLEKHYISPHCSVCNESFGSEGELSIHMISTHSRKDPFKCDQCDESFDSEINFSLHKKIHTRKKLPSVSVNKRFYDDNGTGNLIVHTRTHLAEDPCRRLLKCNSDDCRDDTEKKIEGEDQAQCSDVSAIEPKPRADTAERLQERKVGTNGNDRNNEVHECARCTSVFSTSQLLEAHLNHCGVPTFDALLENNVPRLEMLLDSEKHVPELEREELLEKPELRPIIFNCSVCDEAFTSVRELSIHVRTHPPAPREDPFHQCDQCSGSFDSEINLSSHKLSCTENNIKINSTSLDIGGNDKLIRYTETQSAENLEVEDLGTKQINKCNACRTTLNTRHGHTLYTTLLPSGELLVGCFVCGAKFNDEDDLVEHGRKRLERKPYSCGDCGQIFTHKSSLAQHRRRVHTGTDLLSCTEFNNTSSDDDDEDDGKLMNNQITQFQLADKSKEAGKKQFICNECGKIMISGQFRDCHTRLFHTGERMKHCFVCGYKFPKWCILVNHYRLHTGERPFLCDECGKVFSQRSILVNHKRTYHIGERRFKCSECGKAFFKSEPLKVHMRIHTGKPFKCSECDKLFATMGNQRVHMRVHHKQAWLKLNWRRSSETKPV